MIYRSLSAANESFCSFALSDQGLELASVLQAASAVVFQRPRARPTHTAHCLQPLYTLRHAARPKNAAHFDARGHKHENRQI